MKLLAHNGIIQLFEKVRSLEEEPHDSWRCIHISLSDQGKYNAALRTYFFVKPITELLADHDGFIYVCEDGDIFILFQGLLQPVLDGLNEHFADMQAERSKEAQAKSLFTVFDLSRYWREFFRLCETKSRQVIYASIQSARRENGISAKTPEEFASQ